MSNIDSTSHKTRRESSPTSSISSASTSSDIHVKEYFSEYDHTPILITKKSFGFIWNEEAFASRSSSLYHKLNNRAHHRHRDEVQVHEIRLADQESILPS
ncbi:hypothetical protein K7432_013984 [Basidiobolus ranarum]|uniref:Uncharacterized protein n=1 Tax=Basidiobolus ranarum TaxID=34480 RepID=A0ABR2VR38_9FUNG